MPAVNSAGSTARRARRRRRWPGRRRGSARPACGPRSPRPASSPGTISEYTCASRTRRAISWAYWAPKSTTRTVGGCTRPIYAAAPMTTGRPGRHTPDSTSAGRGRRGWVTCSRWSRSSSTSWSGPGPSSVCRWPRSSTAGPSWTRWPGWPTRQAGARCGRTPCSGHPPTLEVHPELPMFRAAPMVVFPTAALGNDPRCSARSTARSELSRARPGPPDAATWQPGPMGRTGGRHSRALDLRPVAPTR